MNKITLHGGRIELYHGDCLEVMPTLTPQSIDMILADLPYGTTACKWDSIIPLKDLWAAYSILVKKESAIALTASQPFTSILVTSNLDLFKYELIWHKDRPSNIFFAKTQPLKYHENIVIFSQAKAHNQASVKMKYNPQMEIRHEKDKRKNNVQHYKNTGIYGNDRGFINIFDKYLNDEKNPSSVQKFNTNRSKSLHPTQKPVALMEYLIKTYTNEGDLVLDNTMGSGTTGVACINTGRRFVGIELDKGYFDIAVTRCQEALNAHNKNGK